MSRKLKETKTDAVVEEAAASALSIAKDLVTSLNKSSKIGAVAHMLSEESDTLGYISTGSSLLDLAISNRPYGGVPVGRITEISGLEQSGKSLLGAHILASTQRMGGIPVLIDTEAASTPTFMRAIGMDLNSCPIIQATTIEEVFDRIEFVIEQVRRKELEHGQRKVLTIVVDSVAAVSTKSEMEASFDAQGWATQKARIISQAMRKLTNEIKNQLVCLVFINQLRIDPTVTFGDKYTTPGGKGIGFHASVRLRLQQSSKIKAKINGREELIGYSTKATVHKNRLGPPGKVVFYNILFSSGIDDESSWFDPLVDYGIIKQGGAWYTYIDTENGEEVKFQSKDFRTKLTDVPHLRKQLYDRLCKEMVMEYDLKSDVDVEFDNNVDEPADLGDVAIES